MCLIWWTDLAEFMNGLRGLGYKELTLEGRKDENTYMFIQPTRTLLLGHAKKMFLIIKYQNVLLEHRSIQPIYNYK